MVFHRCRQTAFAQEWTNTSPHSQAGECVWEWLCVSLPSVSSTGGVSLPHTEAMLSLVSSFRTANVLSRSSRTVVALRVAPAVQPYRRGLAGKVAICSDEADFDKAVKSEHGSVVYFTASWCGPCRMISPVFQELAEGASDKVTFLKCDVDEQPEVAADAQVAAMPTFQFYKSGTLLHKLVGADVEGLKAAVKEHLD